MSGKQSPIIPDLFRFPGFYLLPHEIEQTLLIDSIERDRTTARRAALVRVLWQERYLTREGLISRVEGELGRGCFGSTAWEDTFYRDMCLVRKAMEKAGYQLAYSRNKANPGYYLRGQSRLHADLVEAIAGSVAEVDPVQISIYHRLSPAERFRQGCSISDTARRAVAYRFSPRSFVPSNDKSSPLQ